MTDDFINENIEDVECADERYKRFALTCIFEDDEEEIELEE